MTSKPKEYVHFMPSEDGYGLIKEEDEKWQQLVGARAPLHCQRPDILVPKVRYFSTSKAI